MSGDDGDDRVVGDRGADARAGGAGDVILDSAASSPTAAAVNDEFDIWVDAVVSVRLTMAARSALQAGTLVQVDLISDRPRDRGGYRIFLRAGPGRAIDARASRSALTTAAVDGRARSLSR